MSLGDFHGPIPPSLALSIGAISSRSPTAILLGLALIRPAAHNSELTTQNFEMPPDAECSEPLRLARLVETMQARLKPGQGRRPGRPTDANWVPASQSADRARRRGSVWPAWLRKAAAAAAKSVRRRSPPRFWKTPCQACPLNKPQMPLFSLEHHSRTILVPGEEESRHYRINARKAA